MPKGPRKFYFAFEKSGLTRFGGLSLFQAFCRSLQIRRFLQVFVRWPDYDYRGYHPADLFLAHVFSIVVGLGRIENTRCLLHNGLIPPLLGLNDFPHRHTLRTFLRRFDAASLRSLQAAHDKLRTVFFQRLGLAYSAVVDADTTTLMTYGSQERVARGYIPKRRHWQASYAPILSSEGRSGLSLGMELRAGNVQAVVGAAEFLDTILRKLPSSIAASRTRLRLDAGFYDRKTIEPLENQGFGHVVVARMYRPLKKRMLAAHYHEFARGWEAAEFTYTPFHWKREHRFVAVRRPVSVEPEEIQLRLFTFKRYTYHRALVTNLDSTPAAVWRFYCDRGFQELLLRELKISYAMNKIPSRSFGANAAYLEAILWAYDLVLAFQRLCLPPEVRHWNISTLRRDLWWLPAEWIRRGNRNLLLLPAKYPQQDLFAKIQRAAARVQSLI
jgi:Transposase DDE domain group 1